MLEPPPSAMRKLLASYFGDCSIAVPAILLGILSLSRPTSGGKPLCVPGYYFNRTSDECDPCPEGTYAGHNNRDSRCSECTRCTGIHRVAVACKPTTDTKCACPSGYYEHADGCSPVQQGNPSPHSSSIQTDENQESPGRQGTMVYKASEVYHDLVKNWRLLGTSTGASNGEPIIALLSALVVLVLIILVVLVAIYRKKLVSLCGNRCRKAASGVQSAAHDDINKSEMKESLLTTTQIYTEPLNPQCAEPTASAFKTRTCIDPSSSASSTRATNFGSEPSNGKGHADRADTLAQLQAFGGGNTGQFSGQPPGAARKAESCIETIEMRERTHQSDAETASLLDRRKNCRSL